MTVSCHIYLFHEGSISREYVLLVSFSANFQGDRGEHWFERALTIRNRENSLKSEILLEKRFFFFFNKIISANTVSSLPRPAPRAGVRCDNVFRFRGQDLPRGAFFFSSEPPKNQHEKIVDALPSRAPNFHAAEPQDFEKAVVFERILR